MHIQFIAGSNTPNLFPKESCFPFHGKQNLQEQLLKLEAAKFLVLGWVGESRIFYDGRIPIKLKGKILYKTAMRSA